ncbi:MAG TPA: response regulator transcription factor [bacterium]|nr:response regulator transcription factor [bacterium]HOL48027.1 response regulator transcription factor [bacterium]HPQ19141.1 response regulator transcription factor [bacterium]
MKNKKRILIIDDDVSIRLLLKELLQKMNYEVDLCEDVVRMFGSIQFNIKPDLIILDVMMELMDGFEIYTQLRNISGYENIPVIFLTALASDKFKKKALELGAAAYIEKPFNIPELLDIINKCLNKNV